MAIHTFGEHLDFHPHLHALVADGLFVRSGLFHVLPDVGLKPLKEVFRARVIIFLVDGGLRPPKRANMLCGWVHSRFNVHCIRRVLPDERENLERLQTVPDAYDRAVLQSLGLLSRRFDCVRSAFAAGIDIASPIPLHCRHESAPSGLSHRASARASRKTISYQSFKKNGYVTC